MGKNNIAILAVSILFLLSISAAYAATLENKTPTFNPIIADDVGTSQQFNVEVFDPDNESPTVKWFLEGIEVSSGNQYTFVSDGTVNDFIVKAQLESMPDSETWQLKVTDTPVTAKYEGSLFGLAASELENASGVTIQMPSQAMVNFGSQELNLSLLADVDRHVALSLGLAAIDISKHPELSAPAKVTFLDLDTSGTPFIYTSSDYLDRDGAQECPLTRCTDIVFDRATGRLDIEVTGMQTYYAIINHRPVANAGPSVQASVSELVTLDGTASSDSDGDSLSYSWALAEGPSSVTLSNSSSKRPSFTPSVPGAYIFNLTVSDGKETSLPSVVVVSVYQSGLRITDVEITSEDEDDELFKGEPLTVEVDIENEAGVDIEAIELRVYFRDDSGNILEDDDGDEIEEISDFELDDGDDEGDLSDDEHIFVFDNMPRDVEDGDRYTVIVEAIGRSSDDPNIIFRAFDDAENFEFVVERHDVSVVRSSIVPSVVSCTRSVTLDILLRNDGEDEEPVDVRIRSAQLGISQFETYTLDEDPDDDDNEARVTYRFTVPESVNDGIYQVTAEITYEDEVIVENFDLEVESCRVSQAPDDDGDDDGKGIENGITVVPGIKSPEQPTAEGQNEGTGDAFFISPIVIIAASAILMTGLLILMIGAIVYFAKR